MYCRSCGKELLDNSNFCPNCGANQNNTALDYKARIFKFIKEHKKLSYVYGIWFLMHITLLISSSKNKSGGFYPWNCSFSDLLDFFMGKKTTYFRYDFSWLDEYNVYDFSEFFFYTILFPAVICGLVNIFHLRKRNSKSARRENL